MVNDEKSSQGGDQNPHDPYSEADSTRQQQGVPISVIADDKEANTHPTQRPILLVRLWRSFHFWRTNPFRVKRSKSTIAEMVTIFLTCVIAIIGFLQYSVYRQQKAIMESSGHQTDQLIDAADIQARASRRIADASRREAHAADRNASAAEDFSESAGAINEQSKAAVSQFKSLAESTNAALGQSDKAFRISQQPLIAIGRKDGLIAEFRESTDPDWYGIVLYFQNTGHLPALSVCVETEIFGIKQGGGISRVVAKEGIGRFSVGGSGCPTVAGDSVFTQSVEPDIPREKVEKLRTMKGQPFFVNATVQYCDSFGKYTCTRFAALHVHKYDDFRNITQFDCSLDYGVDPAIPPVEGYELLPPCDQPGDEEKRKQGLQKWKREHP